MKHCTQLLYGGLPSGASGASSGFSKPAAIFLLVMCHNPEPKIPPPRKLPIDPPQPQPAPAPDEDTDCDHFVEPPGFKAAVRRLRSGRKPSEIALRLRAERKAQGLARLHKLMAVLEELKSRNAVL